MISRKDPDAIRSYLEDSSNLKGGHAEAVLVPETIGELSSVLKSAYRERTPVTISGGGTTTTGSRIPFGGVVISLERFNKISDISNESRSATVQAGVTVDELKKAADRQGLFYTSHPTEGSAFVGGTISTNASGARSFKYGPTRDYVRRLKMVFADGEIIDLTRGERLLTRSDSLLIMPSGREIMIPLPTYTMPDVKRSSGYFARDGMDLIDLFIGQEGTLSVIVEAEITLVAKPEKILSAFVFFRCEEDAWNFAREARSLSIANRRECGTSAIDALSIEYFDPNALVFLRAKNAHVPQAARSAIFFEQETVPGMSEDTTLDAWLALINKYGASLDDTWVAMNEAEAGNFSSFRYAIPEAVNDIVRKNGFPKLSTDIAVPEPKFIEMMNFYKSVLDRSNMQHVVFGHIGECHVHGNVLPKTDKELRAGREIVMSFVEKGVGLGGSVSAEHGIGKIKHKYLEVMYGTSGVLEMSKVKKAFDPHCILGLDNIFPKELLS